MTQNSLSPFNWNLLLFWHSDKKIEFDSWPALLDEVQDQYEINGGKLWFPLYSVLQHRQSDDITAYNHSVGAFASPSQKDGNFKPAVLIDGDCERPLMWPRE